MSSNPNDPNYLDKRLKQDQVERESTNFGALALFVLVILAIIIGVYMFSSPKPPAAIVPVVTQSAVPVNTPVSTTVPTPAAPATETTTTTVPAMESSVPVTAPSTVVPATVAPATSVPVPATSVPANTTTTTVNPTVPANSTGTSQ